MTCTAFGKADGLLTSQFNGVAKPAGWKSRDGRLWFASIRGVVTVDCRIKTNEQPPPVAIEEVIADRQLDARSQPGARAGSLAPLLEIPPGRGELEFHYTALSLQAPEKNRFKYMLEGVDSGWNDAGTERQVHYSHVGPGTYYFRVLACNNDGVWNEKGAALALRVAAAFLADLVVQSQPAGARRAAAHPGLSGARWPASRPSSGCACRSRPICTTTSAPA